MAGAACGIGEEIPQVQVAHRGAAPGGATAGPVAAPALKMAPA
jgi:hypothetical protein